MTESSNHRARSVCILKNNPTYCIQTIEDVYTKYVYIFLPLKTKRENKREKYVKYFHFNYYVSVRDVYRFVVNIIEFAKTLSSLDRVD